MKKDYKDIQFQEELYWHQKARLKWFHLGDKNTRFFYVTTVAMRKKNRIEALKDEIGNWIMDDFLLKEIKVQYYNSLFTEENTQTPKLKTDTSFTRIQTEEAQRFMEQADIELLRRVVFDMGSFKAPGLDGLQPIFYQT